jgi:hypothetical protein
MSNTDKTDFNKIFEQERSEWKERIQVLAIEMKDIKTLAKAQVDLFSQRQVLLEYSYKLASIVSKLNSKYRTEKSRKLKDYSERSDVRYGANEKTVLIEGDISEITEKIELVEGHRKFMDQTVQTIDHMLYGIKSRIALEEYLRGSTVK